MSNSRVHKRRTVRWMGLPIDVNYIVDGAKGTYTSYDLKKGVFSLTFRDVDFSCVAHECWHLFMRVMQWMDGRNGYAFDELVTEIYAWNFGTLVGEVHDALAHMIAKVISERVDDTSGEDR